MTSPEAASAQPVIVGRKGPQASTHLPPNVVEITWVASGAPMAIA